MAPHMRSSRHRARAPGVSPHVSRSRANLVFRRGAAPSTSNAGSESGGCSVPDARSTFDRAASLPSAAPAHRTGPSVDRRLHRNRSAGIGWSSPPRLGRRRKRFTVHTTVTFEDYGPGTRMTVRQD